MDWWALVLADSVLLLVALAGGILTLVRTARIGGATAGFAAAGCGVLVLGAIFDLAWWILIFPAVVDVSDDVDSALAASQIGNMVTWLMIAIGVALLIVASNLKRPAAAAAHPQVLPGQIMPGQTMPSGFPATGPSGAANGPVSGPSYGQPAAPQAQPAQGWTPPQQAQPDWNIHSGVWSIPRGTFDGPPPSDQQQR